MCFIVIERYSICRCVYYMHSVDGCAAYGTEGHPVQERVVLVGYECDSHSTDQSEALPYEGYSDSGYRTASHRSIRKQSNRSRNPEFALRSPEFTSRNPAFSNVAPANTSSHPMAALPGELPTGDINGTAEKSVTLRDQVAIDAEANSAESFLALDNSDAFVTQTTYDSSNVLSSTIQEEDASEEKGKDGNKDLTESRQDTASTKLQTLRARLLNPDQYLQSLIDLEEDVLQNSSLFIYSSEFAAINLEIQDEHYHDKELFIQCPDIPESLAGDLPTILTDDQITSIYKETNRADSATRHHLDEIRTSRNVLVKTYLNLKRLQKANFCLSSFSIIIADKDRKDVAKLQMIHIADVVALIEEVESTIRACADAGPATIIGSTELITGHVKLFCRTLLAPENSGNLISHLMQDMGFVSVLRLLVHVLDLAVVSYAGAHIGNSMQESAQLRISVDILAPYRYSSHFNPSSKFVFKLGRFSLQCLDSFHHGRPVWVFGPSQWNPSNPLYLSTRIEAFADIWGPLWKEMDIKEPGICRTYVVGNGSIVQWPYSESAAPKLEGEVFCHWIADSEGNQEETQVEGDIIASRVETAEAVATSKAQMVSSPPSFTGAETLLIGAIIRKVALTPNPQCKFSISSARIYLRNIGRLCILGSSDSFHYNDSNQYQLQVGYGGVNASATKQYKRVPGQNLKDVLIELWAMEPEIRDPKLLQDLYGVKISMCTHNAQRISISNLLGLNCMRSFLKHFKWEDEGYKLEYFECLKDPSRRTRLVDRTFRGQFERAIMICLKMLSKTGVDRKDDLQVFLSSACTAKPELATLVPKDHTWVGLLRDTTTDCAMAAFADECLEFAHDLGASCGKIGRSVLQTSLVINTLLEEFPLKTIQDHSRDGPECVLKCWDISSLKAGKDFRLGSRGTLSMKSHLDDGALLMTWSPLSLKLTVKGLLSKELYHREFSEIDHSGESGIRPIPVFVVSDRSRQTEAEFLAHQNSRRHSSSRRHRR